ncbi:MAG: metal-sensitive transcriptional regulator [Chloroflexi bacterium]|nr:metal-sensitive transcriptional regulator [Chloroflexota bacterium]
MQDKEKQQVLLRLKSIEGHLRGIQTMVEEDRYCIDILKQTKAVQRALAKVDSLILDNHLRTCVTRALRSQDGEERDRVVEELLDVYDVSSKM